MRVRRFVTVDERSRITLGSAVATPGTTYRIAVHPGNGTITLVPVEIHDVEPE